MARISTFAARHGTAAYFALTFAISWGGVLLVIGGPGGLLASTAPEDWQFARAVLAMLAGPSAAGLILIAATGGRAGMRDLVVRAGKWRTPARWQVVALATAPLLWCATLLALSPISPAFLPGLLTAPEKLNRVAVGLAVAAGAGIFEELGWTGFATPRLRKRHGALATGVILGVLWGAWHLLTNVLWGGRVAAGELPLGIFLTASIAGVLLGYLVAFRVLMVWVYDRTGSLLLAMLMHGSLTASVLILDPVALTGTTMIGYSLALAASVWIAVVAVGIGEKEVPMPGLPRARVFQRSAIAAGALLVVVQLVPYGRTHTNPATVAEPPWDSPRTRVLAERACFDCHSNQTRWPAYASVAPVSWLVQHDVSEGRAELNFSEWHKPQREATNAASEVREHEMPPFAYRLMHGHARLTPEERDALARGLFNTLAETPEH